MIYGRVFEVAARRAIALRRNRRWTARLSGRLNVGLRPRLSTRLLKRVGVTAGDLRPTQRLGCGLTGGAATFACSWSGRSRWRKYHAALLFHFFDLALDG